MSTLNDLLAQQKQIQEQLKALSPDELQKSEREKVKTDMQADIDTFSTGMDSQISNTQNYYGKLEDDTKTAYESKYERNAVQKLVNEKQIAERNANLGLTDSGLNRTQQTAAQLSYANQKADIDLARQGALDELSLKLTDAVTTLQNEKASGIRNITNQWNSYADTRAENIYKTQYDGLVNQYNDIGDQITKIAESENDAAAEVQKALISASRNISEEEDTKLFYTWSGETVKDQNGNVLIKFISNDGKSYASLPGRNPYTNDVNAQISKLNNGKCIIDTEWQSENKNNKNLIQRACATFGVFSNGYQPKGIYITNGEGEIIGDWVKDTGKTTTVTGKKQIIWESHGKEWYWDDYENRYVAFVVVD